MKRRALLSTVSSSAAAGLAGCSSVGTESCAGETWTGLGYGITLNDVSYDPTTGEWEGRCSLSVSFGFVDDGNPGITDAGIALYGDDGHRVGLVEFGDVMWQDVPEAARSTMDCGGYETGGQTRSGEFTSSVFPTEFGLWYSQIRSDVVDYEDALTFGGNQPSPRSVEPSQWRHADVESGSFPSVPAHAPALGDRVETATIASYGRGCSSHDPGGRVDHDVYCCQLGVSGTLVPTNIQFVPGVKRAAVRPEEDVLAVTVQMRAYRRPPAVTCNSPRVQYTVGIDLAERSPGVVAVTHLDVEGNRLGGYRVETGAEHT